MSDTKNLKFSEKSLLTDKFDISNITPTSFLRGRVVMRDEKGNIFLEKDNMIVLRGRTFALEHLFKDPISASSGYTQDLDRKICLFKIGDGGADVETAPFDPFVPSYQNLDLSNPVPFITVDPNKNADPIKQANPSIVTELAPGDELIYYDKVVDGGDPAVFHYYGKVFDTAPEWTFNEAGNEVYKKVTLRINTKDARNQYVNELGLFFASLDTGGNVYENIEIFSRICFDTESLTNLTKQIVIEYFIYA